MTNSRQEIEEILNTLSLHDLLSLVSTVTEGILKNKINNKKDAINAIIHHSESTRSILKRKIVTREVLLSYLFNKNIPCASKTKNDLVNRVLEYLDSLEATPKKEREDKTKNEPEPIRKESTSITKIEEDNVNLLANQFTKWFYSLYNETNTVGAEHFFEDTKMKVNIYSNESSETEISESNPEEISELLNRLKMKYNLYFNPNDCEKGIRGRMNSHGLVIVLACGTLHIKNDIVGVFEQVFALARDPFTENNWKIKRTELNLRSMTGITSPPNLTDSEFTSQLLCLPANEL